MSESAVGVSVAVTRQNGNGAETVIVAAPLLAVVVYGAVISVADVTVPSGSGNVFRFAHGEAARAGTAVSPTSVIVRAAVAVKEATWR
jgi:hypothetical protein